MNIFNRFFISIFLLLGFISTFSYATGTETNIITEDKTNTSMVNTLGATDIVNLSAHITNSTAVISNFIIKSLPSANLGLLYMADGTTVVTVGQRLTRIESDGLKFDPVESCTAGNAQFTYVGVSDAGVEGSLATVTLPLSISTGCSVTVTSDDKNNPEMLNSLGAQNILDLSGKDSTGASASSFVITSLADASGGVLYLADGTTAVSLNQTLRLTEANGLRFDPKSNFIGEVTFTYIAVNNSGVRGNLATVTIPIISLVAEDKLITDNKNNPPMLNTLGVTNIVNLSAHNNAGSVNNFIIKSLPNASLGILYLADGITNVLLGQQLTQAQADGLKFDPKESCTKSDATFTYAGVSDAGLEGTVGTVTLPLTVANECVEKVTTDDKNNPQMLNTLGAVNILDLSGKDRNGDSINNFIITSLPTANQGVLYMADGTTAIRLNQTLTITEANGLRFDPNPLFIGEVTFTYVALDDNGVRGNSATVTIPVVAPTNGNRPTADNKNNPQMSNSLGAVNILDLSGKESNGEVINNFIITSLPRANQGILYMADGTTPILLNQTLTLVEANGLRFDPNENFVGDVTFTYVALDDNGVKSTNATVTIPLINPVGNAPTADDKVNPEMLNTLGAVNILDLSGKDSNGDAIGSFIITSLPRSNQGVLYMSDGTTPVRLNQTVTLAEANGLKFDPNINFVGDVTFMYMAVDANGIKSSNATVTIPVVASFNTDIVTHDDVGVAHGNADPIIIDVLANDTGTLAGASVLLVNNDGTFTNEITVNGEGVWSVNSDNTVVFTPVTPFVGTPTSMDYVVRDSNGAVSNTSTVSIKGQCVCKPYREDIPVFSGLGLFLMMLFSTLLGMGLLKRESIIF